MIVLATLKFAPLRHTIASNPTTVYPKKLGQDILAKSYDSDSKNGIG